MTSKIWRNDSQAEEMISKVLKKWINATDSDQVQFKIVYLIKEMIWQKSLLTNGVQRRLGWSESTASDSRNLIYYI